MNFDEFTIPDEDSASQVPFSRNIEGWNQLVMNKGNPRKQFEEAGFLTEKPHLAQKGLQSKPELVEKSNHDKDTKFSAGAAKREISNCKYLRV